MREIVLEERRQRLERFLRKIETVRPRQHLARRWAIELLDLYYGYLRTMDKAWPETSSSSPEQYGAAADPVLSLYIHDPVANRIKQALSLLEAGDPVAAKKFLREMASEDEGDRIRSEIQTIYAKRKHKGGPFEDLLISIYKKDPRISGKQFEREVLKHVGGPVIRSMNERLNEIVLVDGRVFSISGLEDRLSKLKAKY